MPAEPIPLPGVGMIVYRNGMACERHILRLLLAAIVMIAAYVMPSAANAHEGHAGAGHGSHRSHQIHELKQPASSDGVGTAFMASVRHELAVAAPASVRDCSPRCLACSVCGVMGCGVVGCCGTAAILSSSGSLPQRLGHAVALIAAALMTPLGIGPEALSEPPRSYA